MVWRTPIRRPLIIRHLPLNTSTVFRSLFFLLLAVCGGTVVAQSSWVGDDMPFLPYRNNTHLRCVKEYEPSTVVMGARSLQKTTYYDRHGYEVADDVENQYDSLGRMVRQVKLEYRFNEECQCKRWDTVLVRQVVYSPEGLVSLYRSTYYEWHLAAVDTAYVTYRLLHFSYTTGIGVTRCDYAYCEESLPSHIYGSDRDVILDTVVCLRDFDEKGRLLRQLYVGGSRGLDDEEVRYTYDEYGRVAYELHSFYGGYDSLEYRYNDAGDLMEKIGKRWEQGEEADIFESCQPNGTPIEHTEIWYPSSWDYGENPENRIVNRFKYDSHGNLMRWENASAIRPVLEYDNEYYTD